MSVNYLCQDCLTTFDEVEDLHRGDQYCEPCKELSAAKIGQGWVRQMNLEEMGFSPAEVGADLEEWQMAEAAAVFEWYGLTP